MNGSQPKYYDYLTAIRGIAFLGVLAVHCANEVGSFPGKDYVLGGRHGVQLFFLASAMTLLFSMDERNTKEANPVSNYFIRRLFRIAPLFWSGIVFYGIWHGLSPRYWAPDGVSWWHFLTTATFTHGWVPTSITSIVPGGWSIAVEFTFYLLLPFSLPLFRSAYGAFVTAFALLIGSLVVNSAVSAALRSYYPTTSHYLIDSFIFLWFPSQAAVFALGAALARLAKNPNITQRIAYGARPYALLAGAIFLSINASFSGTRFIPSHIIYTAAFMLLILGLAVRPVALLVNRPICRIGTLSFSCYITHFAIIAALAPRIVTLQSTPRESIIQFLLLFVLSLAGTTVVSAITYWLIEKPGIELGRRWIAHREKRASGMLIREPYYKALCDNIASPVA